MIKNATLLLTTLVVLGGCEMNAGASIKATHETTNPVPPELGGSGNNTDSIKIEIEIKLEACYPNCSKSSFSSQLQQMNLLVDQQGTYSTPINSTGIINITDRDTGQFIESQTVGLTTVGNQTRLANPALVADKIFHLSNRNLSIIVLSYFETVGFNGTNEYISFQARSGTHILDIDGLIYTINCGPELPNGQPEQACRPE